MAKPTVKSDRDKATETNLARAIAKIVACLGSLELLQLKEFSRGKGIKVRRQPAF
jgi:hypothetical protein